MELALPAVRGILPTNQSQQQSKNNSSAFKHWINEDLLERMSLALSQASSQFNKKDFLEISRDLASLEMKSRVRLISGQLKKTLPHDYPMALKTLLESTKSQKLKGFDLWPYTEFIQTYGLNHAALSLDTLKILTSLFTAEFAVRPFIKSNPQKTLSFLLACSKDKNVHVRRLASEGSRPRLPWGERLDICIKDPSLTLPILEQLKYDEELYVRKSVSNHLNDITKDHPEFVINLLKKWQKSETSKKHKNKIDWIIKRSLRSLIKEGHPQALQLIGVSTKAKIKVEKLKLNKHKFKLNDRLEFKFQIHSLAKKPQKLVVDYIIHFMKSNKKTSAKVFKLKSVEINAKEILTIKKQHHLKKITTREYYPGVHFIEIQVNGLKYKKLKWFLES